MMTFTPVAREMRASPTGSRARSIGVHSTRDVPPYCLKRFTSSIAADTSNIARAYGSR